MKRRRLMSEEFQKMMFDPFAQENNPDSPEQTVSGTGLGLSIVKRIVEMMGGTIEISSKQGEGTSVTVILDLPQAEVEGTDRDVSGQDENVSAATLVRKSKFLLVDDNIINREIVVRILGSM